MVSASSESEYNDTEFPAFVGKKNLKKRKERKQNSSKPKLLYNGVEKPSALSSFDPLFSANVSIKITVAKTFFVKSMDAILKWKKNPNDFECFIYML